MHMTRFPGSLKVTPWSGGVSPSGPVPLPPPAGSRLAGWRRDATCRRGIGLSPRCRPRTGPEPEFD